MNSLRDKVTGLESRLEELAKRGVRIVDPRQTYVGQSVDLDRIHPGVVLHPGCRVQGARSFLGPGAEVGNEGPATLIDAVLGADAKVASGYLREAVLLRGASVGANAQLRPGTLLEEQASTAHAVGLKHTILMSFVTLGSLINFCDCLMSGGTSRSDHSEVGSGYIHFNFTPWGARGDKATPSMIGDVVRGVFLGERRIFLGGSGGMIGPRQVGYGSVAAAGQVLRGDVEERHMVLQGRKAFDVPVRDGHLGGTEERTRRNVAYVAQLVALRAWYRQVRLERCHEEDREVRPTVEAAIETLDACIAERIRQLARFREERKVASLAFDWGALPLCPLGVSPPEADSAEPSDHVAWVQSLDDEAIEGGQAWLRSISEQVNSHAELEMNPPDAAD
jgi:UDP-N-acetylglucosamine/UDP-N-acetylgalactosamine diphosphorylase